MVTHENHCNSLSSFASGVISLYSVNFEMVLQHNVSSSTLSGSFPMKRGFCCGRGLSTQADCVGNYVEVRRTISHPSGSGKPFQLDVQKAIEKK